MVGNVSFSHKADIGLVSVRLVPKADLYSSSVLNDYRHIP